MMMMMMVMKVTKIMTTMVLGLRKSCGLIQLMGDGLLTQMKNDDGTDG